MAETTSLTSRRTKVTNLQPTNAIPPPVELEWYRIIQKVVTPEQFAENSCNLLYPHELLL